MTQRTPNPDEFLQSTAFMDAIRRIARDEARSLIEVETGIEPNTPHDAVVFDPYGRAIGGAAGGATSPDIVSVNTAGGQSIVNNTATYLRFGTQIVDTDTDQTHGMWPWPFTTAGNTTFHLGEVGTYLILCSIVFPTNATGFRRVDLHYQFDTGDALSATNIGSVISTSRAEGPGNSVCSTTLFTHAAIRVVSLSSATNVGAYVYQNSGSTLAVEGKMTIYKVTESILNSA